jgi:hypothetical protein
MKPANRGLKSVLLATVLALGAVVACGGDSGSPAGPGPGGALAAPIPKSPVGGAEVQGLRPMLEVTNAVATGNVGAVTYRFELSETADFPAGSRTVAMDGVPQGVGTTAVQVPSDLHPGQVYFWRARASNGAVTTAYSVVESLRAENRGMRSGQTIYDPLTNGQTVADERHGGHFVAGPDGGWQADGRSDSLDYDIPTCSSCRVEFDATNFDRSTAPENVDMKWFSMGDGSTFNSFFPFRNHDWKMHLEKRSGDAGAVKLIWRRGCAGDGFCDNTDHRRLPIAWSPSKVYHFTIEWCGGSMSVNICDYDGSRCVATVYQASGQGPYDPPNHRIELGTRPRNETLVGARFRNFRVTPR